MTAELLGEGPADPEAIVVGWLQPLRRTANTRRPGDPLPMTVVRTVAGTECHEESYSDPVVQIDTLCAASAGEDAASVESNKTHRRMLLLARYLEDFNLDYIKVFLTPRREDYGDEQIIRYVARYQLGQSYE